MPWWRFWQPESDEEKLNRQLQQEAVRALESGDIPPIAKRRIEEHLRKEKRCFSSDLSVREFLLTQEAGFQPIAQVMGTCNFNVSYFGSYTGYYRSTGELTNFTEAQSSARLTALQRMIREAELLGASGVIGVRIVSKRPHPLSRHSEFTAYGTAIHVPNYPEGRPPFTSALNGQQFWQLHKAGYYPTGVVLGVCSYYIWTDWNTRMQTSTFGFGVSANQEVEKYTSGFNSARNLAVSRLTLELARLDADGVIGVEVDHDIEEIEYERNDTRYRDLLVNFMAIGTAVKAAHPALPPSPLMCVDLRKGGKNAEVVTLEEYSTRNF